jgi:hypothetical protein
LIMRGNEFAHPVVSEINRARSSNCFARPVFMSSKNRLPIPAPCPRFGA